MTAVDVSLFLSLGVFGAACAVMVGVFVWAVVVELARLRRPAPRRAVRGGPWLPRTLDALLEEAGDTAPLDPVGAEIDAWGFAYGLGEWPLHRELVQDQTS